ncbi:MAG: dTMP kinase [Burkholderiales bacterium]
MEKGKFITLEGLDGAGKTTHLEWLADQLRLRGKTVLVTREPGGTALGERLRDVLLHEPMHPDTEALLMFAARREHLHRVILPALEAGTWVLCDRFTDATMAYQGGGRGIPLDRLAVLERWVQRDLQPDLTLFFDVPVSVALARLQNGRCADRFEQEQASFFERVRSVYLRRTEEFPTRMRLVTGDKSQENVRKQLEDILLTYWQK